MLNKFIKKSIASKFFLMNLIILICIIGSQLLFQVLFFESYYLNKKEKRLEETIAEFKEFLLAGRTEDEIISFIDKVQREEKISLSYKDLDLYDGYFIESFMGEGQIVIKDDTTNKEYKVVLRDQYANAKINKGDVVEVDGLNYRHGYVFPDVIKVNGREIQQYYDIIPKVNMAQNTYASQMNPSYVLENIIKIEGNVEQVILEDKSYILLSNADLYLEPEEKNNILLNYKYVTKTSPGNSIDEMLLMSEKFADGYIITMTPLSEVNDVLGSMNGYYFMIFSIALVVIILVSLVYSRYMAKPLVEMSNIANKISKCDFNSKYNVKTEDEIGVLGNSLNLISSNLEKSLNDLHNTNEKRKELVANISHELKTPITIIQGNINGVKNGMYTEDIYGDILEETNKMNELIKEMLEVSKLESPTFVLNKEAFDLESIFLKEKDKLKSMIKEKNLSITYNDFDEIIVYGDEKRINQVVTNFLTNAIKYTPYGGNVVVEMMLNKDNQYVFSIENFGVSLSKEEVERVWEPFYRKEKSRNKKFGGTGLGLSIVKRILELHNSDFGVMSGDNSVKFYFTLPKCTEY